MLKKMKQTKLLPGGPTDDKDEYLTKNMIKEKYNVTDKVIDMLGNPDKIAKNPYYSSRAPMKLYNKKRVERLIKELQENRPELLEHIRTYKKKMKEVSKKAVETKRAKTLQIIEGFKKEFKIEPYDITKIPELAEQQHMFFIIERGYDIDERGWVPSDEANIAYIRHNLTNYDEILEEIFGKVGVSEAYNNLRKFIDEQIIQDYYSKKEVL